MAKTEQTGRKRGIQASRLKLTHALTAAGLKTQAALAERIADAEGLETTPKDIVSRAFRELPVELQTLERIAMALDVEVHTLFKTSDEQDLPGAGSPSADAPPAPKPPSKWPLAYLLAAVTIAAFMLYGWFRAPVPATPDPRDLAVEAFRPLSLGTPMLVVLPVDGDPQDALGDSLRGALADGFNVASSTAAALTHTMTPQEAAERLRADAVVETDLVTVGRLSGIRIYLQADDVRRQVWAESLPTARLTERQGEVAARVATAVRQATGRLLPDEPAAGYFPIAAAQDDYLAGEQHLAGASNELNIRRAQGRFEAALRADANYARAHSGLCRALLEEFWMDDEERALNDASLPCGQALQLAPNDPVVIAGHARFLQLTGRNPQAIRLYEQIVAADPKDALALTGLAYSRLHAYRTDGDASLLQSARAAAVAAGEADPYVWLPFYHLTTIEWLADDVDAAIRATEAGLEREENEFLLANLGTMYVCAGEYENAQQAYERARRVTPDAYIGTEFLGSLYYFLGDFERSAELRREAIDTFEGGEPEIHEMWGALGDSLRQIGQDESAISAYSRAAEIVERDFLRGNARAVDRAARAYYYTVLAGLAPTTVPASVQAEIRRSLPEIAADQTEGPGHRFMAQTLLRAGQTDEARAALRRATAKCPGYGGYPDLLALASDEPG